MSRHFISHLSHFVVSGLMWFVVYTLPSIYYYCRLTECEFFQIPKYWTSRMTTVLNFKIVRGKLPLVPQFTVKSHYRFLTPTLNLTCSVTVKYALITWWRGTCPTTRTLTTLDYATVRLPTLTGKPWIAVGLYLSLYHYAAACCYQEIGLFSSVSQSVVFNGVFCLCGSPRQIISNASSVILDNSQSVVSSHYPMF